MKDLRAALKENYSLDYLDSERIQYGLWEENYRVETLQGTFFVKRFWREVRLERSYPEMVDGLILSQDLRQVGIPAPLLIKDKAGQVLSKHGERTYQVNEWLEGRTYRPGDLPDQAAYQMGRLLGELHLKMNPTLESSRLDPLDLNQAYKAKLSHETDLKAGLIDEEDLVLSHFYGQLEALRGHFHKDLRPKSYRGRVYNSFWVEQVMFDENDQVKGLIDWTDGAGRQGYLIQDIDTAIFVSAFKTQAIVAFARGYQEVLPMALEDWMDLIEYTCIHHLANEWIYTSWLKQTCNRYDHWKTMAKRWLEAVDYRAKHMKAIQEALSQALSQEA